MPDIKQLKLEEAERQLKMNLSLSEMLKKNTSLEVIANFRDEWVTPLETLIKNLRQEVR